MNYDLMEMIVRHVFANLAIIPSDYINLEITKPLMTKEFLLDKKLTFEVNDSKDQVIKNKIWGCQISAEQTELKILLGDCSQENSVPEFSLIVQLKDTPAYGVYLVYNDLVDKSVDADPLIAVTLNNKDWMECKTYLQATFLAGMEQMRDIGLTWQKCSEYQSQYEMMLSFIEYHEKFYEAKYEGQEN